MKKLILFVFLCILATSCGSSPNQPLQKEESVKLIKIQLDWYAAPQERLTAYTDKGIFSFYRNIPAITTLLKGEEGKFICIGSSSSAIGVTAERVALGKCDSQKEKAIF